MSCACACFQDHSGQPCRQLASLRPHRSRERRQRSWWRDEQLSVASAVATAFHHSAHCLRPQPLLGESLAIRVGLGLCSAAFRDVSYRTVLHSLMRLFFGFG